MTKVPAVGVQIMPLGTAFCFLALFLGSWLHSLCKLHQECSVSGKHRQQVPDSFSLTRCKCLEGPSSPTWVTFPCLNQYQWLGGVHAMVGSALILGSLLSPLTRRRKKQECKLVKRSNSDCHPLLLFSAPSRAHSWCYGWQYMCWGKIGKNVSKSLK